MSKNTVRKYVKELEAAGLIETEHTTVTLKYGRKRNGNLKPYTGKIRKPGTGCITMINEHLYEGRYSPKVNGKRMARNVYAATREECEEKLAEMIREMKAEISEINYDHRLSRWS